MIKLFVLILLVFGVSIAGATSTEVTYTAKKQVSALTAQETILVLIKKYEEKYDTPQGLLLAIVKAESSLNPLAEGDMDIICRRTGEPVRARGLVQITACWHPSVSDEEAYDPAFSLEFLAKNLKKGRCHWWTTCRRYTKTKIYVSLL